MQDFENFQELSDQDLENVVGGHNHHSSNTPTFVSSGISVSASASGGTFHFDAAITKTVSESILQSNGEGLSVSFGFAVGYAF